MMNSRKKKALSLWVSILLFLILGAFCYRVFLHPNTRGGQKYHFGFSAPTMNNPYFIYMEERLRDQIEGDGYKMTTLNAQYDGQNQVDQILDMVDSGIDLLFLPPVTNSDSISIALEACKEAGVPIINIDSAVYDSSYVETLIQSHNYMAGYLCAQDILIRRPAGCQIAIIDDQKAQSVVQRMEGFHDGLGSQRRYPVSARFDTDGTIETAMPVAQEILEKYPDINVIMCGNDTMALGAIAAIRTSGLDDRSILVYGIDGSPDAKKMIADGHMTATAAQSPDNTADEAYVQALRVLSGQEVDALILIDTFLIDQSNVEQYNISGWQ